MSTPTLDILNQIIDNRIKQHEVYSVIGTISNIDESKGVCDFAPLDGAILYDVRLQASESINSGLLVVPKDGSSGIATFIDNEQAFISLISEVDKIIITTENKITIQNGSENFKDIMEGFMDTLISAIITTPAGPGNFSPDVISSLTETKTKLLTLFE